MSVVSQVSNELTSLISESRRRNSEIKHASERSLQILKAFQSSGVTEQVFLAELSQNSDFITPFLLSCSTRNAKFSTIAIQSLQKLIQSHSIPISKLDLLLEAFSEATHLAIDIQLKVLQILPIFVQDYSDFINGDLISKTLAICSILQNPNKVPMVINAASATEQQIVLSLFDKLNRENENDLKEFEVKIDENEVLKVSSNSYDAYRVLLDLCLLIEKHKPLFLPFKSMSESLGFELLESVLLNYTDVFLTHVELGFLVRTKIVPLLLRSFSNSKEFGTVVRVSRIILVLVRNLLDILEIEAEVVLSLLTHVITKDSNLPKWKGILSLEIFQSLFGDFSLVSKIYGIYDHNKDKKNVISDFFNVCSDVINGPTSQRLLDISEIVSVPDLTSITVQNSSIRIPYLELLDKSDIPTTPETYMLVLILNCTNLVSDGIGKFALEKTTTKENTFLFLTDLSVEEQQDVQIVQLKGLIVSNAKSLVSIGTEFLYSCIGNDLFHLLIRTLQKLCHASGVLGLNNQRDSLLLLFSIATISNVSKRPKQQLKKNSIGETLVETINAAFPSSSAPSKIEKSHSRSLNSRHIICFRALSSLTISLGPILQKSWKFILITFQWFDYFLKGPSNYISYKESSQTSDLPVSDLKSLEATLVKLNESTKFYDSKAYFELIQELVQLARISNFDVEDSNKEQIDNEPISNDKFKVCCYNLEFFTKKIGDISQINASRYVTEKSKEWDLITTFLTDVVITPNVIPELKITACSTFNRLLRELAKEGFKDNDHQLDTANLETKLFQSLNDLIDKMLQAHSNDHNFSQIESQMIEETLRTLSELLDRFGIYFTNSWETILHIINSVFRFFEISEVKTSSQTKLLKSSFEILQFILNDFLQSIPLKTLRIIIDVLENFCTQEAELNVSFTAVSYYWLISDFLRQKATSKDINLFDFNVDSFDDLLVFINNGVDDDSKFHVLWLYLLNSLVKVSNDPRSEVKNGAIQTFFRIVDSHGSYLNWNNTFNVVIKDLLYIKISKPDVKEDIELKPFKESVVIILKGVTDLYSRFFINSSNVEYWTELVDFYGRLAELDIIEVTTTVYKLFHQIIGLLTGTNEDNFNIFFRFWTSQQVKYVSADSDAYQLCLVELISSFTTLNKLSELSKSQVEMALSIFNNCVRFPFLPRFTQDLNKPTVLQSTVLTSLRSLDALKYGDIIIQNLSSLVLLPFQTRSRILKKLANKKTDIPSFIGISLEVIELLKEKLLDTQDLKHFIKDKTLQKVMRNLIDSISYKGDDDDDEQNLNILKVELWKKSSSLLLLIIQRIVDILNIPEEADTPETQIWKLIVEFTTITLPIFNDDKDEDFNIELYTALKSFITAHLDDKSLKEQDVKSLVSALWQSSFLYENDELENYLFKTSQDPNEVTKELLQLEIDGFSTAGISPFTQQKFRLICIEDLFGFIQVKDEKLIKITLPFLLCRLVLIIRRFASAQRLVNKSPVVTIQQVEITLTLKKLLQLLNNLSKGESVKIYRKLVLAVFPLILDNHQYIGKIPNSQSLLTSITAQFYKITS